MTQPSSPLQTVSYDRSGLRPRLLHIGFGAFAKAHLLVYHDEMLRKTETDWGVIVSRLNSGAEDLTQLDAADGLFTVGEMAGDTLAVRSIGAVIGTRHPKRDGTAALLADIAGPDLKLITLTITEKGYCLSGGQLDRTNPAIAADLASDGAPTTAIGFLTLGLEQRKASGLGGLTILSCDNLPANGTLCRQAVLDFARDRDPALEAWIAAECRFPCAMVDRITPAMTDASRGKLESALGRPDPAGVLCEPFRQWVIEDSFAGERPAWDLAGAQFVADVAPFEEMKLRLLNGSHSFLAYLGALAGKETISDCMVDPVFLAAARTLMLAEQAPTLDVPEGVDITAYAEALISRFSNSALRHKTTQIASDGSQKLPQRLLAPIRQNMAAGRSWDLSACAVAGWMLYCRGRSETGAPLPVNDPLAERLAGFAQEANGPAYVEQLLALQDVFGIDLPESSAFVSGVQSAFERLSSGGVSQTLSDALV